MAELAPIVTSDSWAVPGVRTREHYVCWQTGVSPARARRLVTIASRWGELPRCEALFRSGSIGEDAMALIARTLRAERDAEVAALAPMMTYSQVATLVGIRPKEPEPAPAREPETRFWDDDDNGFQLRCTADHDEGALLKRALEAARDDLFRTRFPETSAGKPAANGVSWHDALLWMAEVTLNALHPAVRRGGRASDRFHVLMHLDVRDAHREAVAGLHLGPVIRDSLARYLSCDASVSTVLWDGERLVGINPRERTVSDRLRRIIEARDGGCRVPGCGQKRWLHVHHVLHWEDGGLTVASNLCCLCPYHHRAAPRRRTAHRRRPHDARRAEALQPMGRAARAGAAETARGPSDPTPGRRTAARADVRAPARREVRLALLLLEHDPGLPELTRVRATRARAMHRAARRCRR